MYWDFVPAAKMQGQNLAHCLARMVPSQHLPAHHLRRALGLCWRPLGAFGILLGQSWAALESSCGRLGPSWDLLRLSLGSRSVSSLSLSPSCLLPLPAYRHVLVGAYRCAHAHTHACTHTHIHAHAKHT